MAGHGGTMVDNNKIVIVGFDAAWSRNNKGAICAARFVDGQCVEAHAPELVGYDEALRFIERVQAPGAATLVALDQPTKVPNLSGGRPVERVAASVISYIGGGVQPANRSKRDLFGDDAPVWQFLNALRAAERPEEARTATSGRYLIEVFPALALPGMDSRFFGSKAAPKYNPTTKNFKEKDWQAVLEVARSQAIRFSCEKICEWIDDLNAKAESGLGTDGRAKIRKADQDKLDSVICLLIGIHWRFAPRNESIFLGSLDSGYIVSPVNPPVRDRLTQSAQLRGVPVDPSSVALIDVPEARDAKPQCSTIRPNVGRLKFRSARVEGDINRNNQKLLTKTNRSGSDHMQYVWIVECNQTDSADTLCGHVYGSNGSDFFQRKCPRCQGGAAGPSIEGLKYSTSRLPF